MANNESAKKRVRINDAKNMQNKMVKSALKTDMRKFSEACAESKQAGEVLHSKTASAVDKACGKGVIHKNTAARRKSRMAKRLAAAK